MTAQYLLSAEATFAAAHTLPGVPLCERMHGHNWRVRLTVRVAEVNVGEAGMAVDFRVLEEAVRNAVADFDHRYLNELEPFRDRAPTAEWLARVIADRVAAGLEREAPRASVDAIDLWETPQYRVRYCP